MKFTPVTSSTVSGIAYTSETRIMTVRFNSGAIYTYFDVSQEEHDSVVNAKSVGSKLREVIKFKEYAKA